jgi:exonuclease III
MKLFTWNGRAGSASRAWPKISRNYDLVFLQEIARPDLERPHVWMAAARRRWGSALVARRGEIEPVRIRGYDGWVIGGIVHGLADEPFFAFSVHVPGPGSRPGGKSYFRGSIEIARRARRLAGRGAKLILAGDFNIAMARRDESDPLFRTKTEHRTLDVIERRPIGLVSLWSACNPGRAPAQTLRWVTNPSAPYHCDGFLVSPELVSGATCRVPPPSATVKRSSDHNPVVARIATVS